MADATNGVCVPLGACGTTDADLAWALDFALQQPEEVAGEWDVQEGRVTGGDGCMERLCAYLRER